MGYTWQEDRRTNTQDIENHRSTEFDGRPKTLTQGRACERGRSRISLALQLENQAPELKCCHGAHAHPTRTSYKPRAPLAMATAYMPSTASRCLQNGDDKNTAKTTAVPYRQCALNPETEDRMRCVRFRSQRRQGRPNASHDCTRNALSGGAGGMVHPPHRSVH